MRSSALFAVLKILFGSGLTVAAACSLGRWLLRRTAAADALTRGERLVVGFGLGAACLSNIVFFLCAAQLAYTPVFLLVGLALLWLGLRGPADPPAKLAPQPFPRWLLVPLAAFGGLYLVYVMAPESSPDGAGYHLGLVARILREHGFSRITTHMYSMLSQGAEMLFLPAFALGQHSAAKMTHFAFLVAAVALMILFGRRFACGPDSPSAALAGAALFACSPVVGADGASSYNDCALAFFLFLTFYLLLLWDQTRRPALLPAIGIAAGFCYAIKYTGFLALPFALCFLIGKAKPHRFRAAMTVTGVAALFIAPWMIKNLVVIGNPLAPFFNAWFPNPNVHVSFERIYAFYMRHYSGLAEHNWRDYWQVPWELAAAGGKLQGVLGPVFLLAPLALVTLRHKMGRRIWAAAAVFALPWFANIGTRFLIPSLVFVSLAMGMAIWRAPRRIAAPLAGLLLLVHGILSWPSVLEKWNRRQPWRLEAPPPWKAALRIEPEERYLDRVSPVYRVTRLVERNTPPGARVFAPDGVAEAYTSREVLVSYQCALCEVLMDHLVAAVAGDVAPVWSVRFEWNERPLSGLRLVQTASDPLEMWSISEALLFWGDRYIEPMTSWRLRARPNPWDAAMAMDGNPVTRWRTWWPLYPGMSFEIDLPETLPLSALELQCSGDQGRMALRLEARNAAGLWAPLPAQQRRADRDPDREPMRRLATERLKSEGVDYLLVDIKGEGMNFVAPPMARDPGSWGLREVGAAGTARLYRIE